MKACWRHLDKRLLETFKGVFFFFPTSIIVGKKFLKERTFPVKQNY